MTLHERLQALDSHISSEKNELRDQCGLLELDIDQIIHHKIDISTVTATTEKIRGEIGALEQDSEMQFQKDTEFEKLASVPDLRNAYKFVQEWIKGLKDQLSAPHKRYQNYLQKSAEIGKQITKLMGDESEPERDSINGLKAQISHIDNELASKIETACKERRELAEKIYNAKKVVLQFYEDLKHSVETKLADVCDPEFMVSINASFVLNESFFEKFLGQVNQNRKGPFKGTEDGYARLRSFVTSTDWSDFNSVCSFVDGIISTMKAEGVIEDQASSVKEIYDYLFSQDYFDSKYELRLDGKNLNQLSPGEMGLLLLVFYLHLDRENIPLIIDQPEDNLDNDSIYKVLAKCITEAKKNRQVILVTHNPNLAVGADAEQIIYVKLEKADDYKFMYETGAIEDPQINKKIVVVLEGSRPAFVQRRLVYHIK